MSDNTLAQMMERWEPAPESRRAMIDPAISELRSTLGLAGRASEGVLPFFWHDLAFSRWDPLRTLGIDGHRAAGGLYPPIPDRRRMFAGGRSTAVRPLALGQEAERSSRVTGVRHVQGRSGVLAMVTVQHTYAQDGRVCVIDDHDLAYRSSAEPQERSMAGGASRFDGRAPATERGFLPSTVLLHRFSAVTANSHRIHFDQAYAREVEGFDDLVVHGPLLALTLAEAAHELLGDDIHEVRYRFEAPALVDERLSIRAYRTADGIDTEAVHAERGVLARAVATARTGTSPDADSAAASGEPAGTGTWSKLGRLDDLGKGRRSP